MLPALVGQLVVVLKDTALGTIILYPELLTAAKTLGSAYANTVPAYIVVGVIFIVINYSLTRVARFVEQALKRRGHTAGPVTTTVPMIVQGGGRSPAAGSSRTSAHAAGVPRDGPQRADEVRRHGRKGPAPVTGPGPLRAPPVGLEPTTLRLTAECSAS